MCVITKFMKGRNWYWADGQGWVKYLSDATQYDCSERGSEVCYARTLAEELDAELDYVGWYIGRSVMVLHPTLGQ